MKVVEETLYLLVVSVVVSILMLMLSLFFPYEELYKAIRGLESDIEYMKEYLNEI
ncbi:MAG: hypothetical protein ABWK05_01860 [Pyrobaculum sp.]